MLHIPVQTHCCSISIEIWTKQSQRSGLRQLQLMKWGKEVGEKWNASIAVFFTNPGFFAISDRFFFFSTPWNGCLRKAFVKTNWVRLLSVLIQGFVLGWWEWARESLNKYLRPPSTSLSSLHPGPICGGTAGGGGVVASSHCFPWMQPGKEGSKRETNIPWDVEFDSCQYSEGNTEAVRTVHLTS